MIRFLRAAFAALFIVSSGGAAFAQNAGTATNHAFIVGKGAGTTGYTSLLCGSAQLAVGQAAADPICQTVTGDVTISAAGVTAIGATKVTNAMLAAMAANTTKCNATAGSAVPTDCTAATMRTNIGTVIGTNVQAWDADLDAFALKTAPTGAVVGTTDTQTLTGKTIAGASNTLTVRLASDVTGTLPIANGGTNDTGTAWSTYTPTVSCGAGTITTLGTVAGRFKTLGKTVFVAINVVITTIGTCGASLNVSLPVTAGPGSMYNLSGRENVASGKALQAFVLAAGTTASIFYYDNTLPNASGASLNIGGVYESN